MLMLPLPCWPSKTISPGGTHIPRARRTHWAWFVGIAIVGLTMMVLASRYHHDDAFITFRYVQRWLAGSGLNWTDGAPPTEGFTHPLWLLQLAILGRLGLDLLVAARILSGTYLVGTIVFISN